MAAVCSLGASVAVTTSPSVFASAKLWPRSGFSRSCSAADSAARSEYAAASSQACSRSITPLARELNLASAAAPQNTSVSKCSQRDAPADDG
jgi:hypothetical protein